MRRGKIVQQGAPYNVYTRPADKEAVAFFSDVNVLRSECERRPGRRHRLASSWPPAFPDGTEVEIVFRPQHIKLDFDRNGKGPSPTRHRRGCRARRCRTCSLF